MAAFNQLYDNLKNKKIINGTVQIINYNAQFNPKRPLLYFYDYKKTNIDYCMAQLKWYMSQDLNCSAIAQHAKIWKNVCDDNGLVNSNYGWLIFNQNNYNQFQNCIKALIDDQNSRRAIMIYNRPSMHYDYKYNKRNDFICTLNNQFFIRDNKLISIYSMRSNDAIFGFFNDFYWACEVYQMVYKRLLQYYPNLQYDKIIWHANSFHIYSRHFKLLTNIVNYSNSL